GGHPERPRVAPEHGRVGTGAQLRDDQHHDARRQPAEPPHLGPHRRGAPLRQHRGPPPEVQERPARPEGYAHDPRRGEPLPVRRGAWGGRGDGDGAYGPRAHRPARAEVPRPGLRSRRHKDRAGDALDRTEPANRGRPGRRRRRLFLLV
ncbi:MAG: Putative oxidoreductase, partial [uncultured Rubrobacteraceae bacterium]